MGSIISNDKGPPSIPNNGTLDQNNVSTAATTTSATMLNPTVSDPIDLNPNDLNANQSTIQNITTSISGTQNTTNDGFGFELFGTYVYPLRWLTLETLYSSVRPLSSLAMIIGCVMPYVPQYITIYKNQSVHGFSTYVCLTLLIANILRIAFWFGHWFELPLLIQSIIMIIAQLLLLEICVRVKRRNQTIKKSFTSFKINYFWKWTDLLSYIEFLCLFSALLALAMYFFSDCILFVETIGLLALVTESMLGLPQVLKNFKNRSVEGMSLMMVLMWLLGDAYKSAYFVINSAPYQFWLCGLLQITIDLLILFQVCLYRQNAPMKLEQRVDESPKEMLTL